MRQKLNVIVKAKNIKKTQFSRNNNFKNNCVCRESNPDLLLGRQLDYRRLLEVNSITIKLSDYIFI